MSVFDGLRIPYKLVDICQNVEDKELMRNLASDSKALPPQICNGNDYCGVSLTWCSAKIKNIVALCECELLMIRHLQCLSGKVDVLFGYRIRD